MASTVSNGNDRSEKWHRPFQMATTVYEMEICVGERFQRIDKRKTLGDVLQSLGIELELLLVATKLEC